MKRFLLLVSVMVLMFAFTPLSQWQVDPEKSQVTFELPALSKKGTFKNLKAKIVFDENQPEASTIDATVDANTVNAGSDMKNAHLRSPDYFNSDKYPLISFNSTKVSKTDSCFVAAGKLRIRDTIRDELIKFRYMTETSDKATFDGTLVINAGDYGLLKFSKPGGDKVVVRLVVPANKEQ